MKQIKTDTRTIKIRFLAGLEKHSPESGVVSISKGESIFDVLHRLNINRELVQMAFVDGRFIELDTPLDGAEKILLLPAIGGG